MNQTLINKAMEMRNNAHAPYSNYLVGAAVETESGEILGGCNVESSSYGLTCCAERVSLFRAIAEGYTSFKALAVATDNGGSPCGACRQVIWDLCKNIPVHICDKNGLVKTIFSSELLPHAFDDSQLT
ncbi:MAG: cytidine deaminase [Candidatus Marinimicrobia bacterium]|jgi:cytidine deaminase|nr:cytidine deaminase [Candidatus Neomarinimicrobiota bacterium]MBT3839038.1 cytidine deaminase [Candidatus Neomarinimicrobiota bacterium]MBT3999287.1 cytidine deaminase [Candidatus Neomarinimicrobiota bacterium]MBT4282761.1 cytidine deaminase [Candidatus Neomarinimicrobiota bacterium]MBT4578325.1 cytidine deaminase [Candidatus Neomarinimicrobiota bacterium]